MSRIIASPILCMALVHDYRKVVLGGIVVCAFSDWLDGYLAKKLNQQTIFGGMLDPIADKVFLCSLATGLTILDVIPFPLAAVIIGRDILLVACTFVIRAVEKPPNAPFFDTTITATLEVTPSKLSKFNTAMQFLSIGGSLCNHMFSLMPMLYLEPLWYLTGVTTIISGLSYINGSGFKRIRRFDADGNIIK